MSDLEAVRSKAQRILSNKLGRVEVDRDGDFIVRYNSAVAFISVMEGFGDGSIIQIECPLITGVKITNELCRWVAVEGQHFKLGSCRLSPDEDGKTGIVIFHYSMTADDLDESELMNGVAATIYSSDRLDNELQEKFGGEVFGKD